VTTANFRFDPSNSLQAIWPVAGQIVTAYNVMGAFTWDYRLKDDW